MHVTDIRKPLARALWWKKYAFREEELAGEYSRIPEVREAYDTHMEEAERATDRWEAIIRSEWELRAMSRGYVPSLADSRSNARVA